jgi:hypothetical protein
MGRHSTRLRTGAGASAAVVAALAFAGAALAADPARTELSLELVGRISGRCALGDIGDHALGDLTRPGMSVETAVPLDCNVPFDLRIRSLNGGLAHDTLPGGQGPYAGTLDYRLSVSLPVRLPARQTVTAAFTSRQLRAGQSLSSRGGIATDGARLRLDMAAPSGAGLLAGAYSETVEIALLPRL